MYTVLNVLLLVMLRCVLLMSGFRNTVELGSLKRSKKEQIFPGYDKKEKFKQRRIYIS